MTFKWIKKDVVIAIHNMQIFEHGGDHGLRDEGLLESALMRPRNKFEYENVEISTLAASYAYGIIKNHSFIDGNKRTAFVTCLLFLELNGYILNLTKERLYELFINLSCNKISETEFAEILKENMIMK